MLSSLYIVMSADTGPPLAVLKGPAGSLKDAAKKDHDSEGLHYHANQLATHKDGNNGLEDKATAVIDKFGEVESRYKALMEAATTSGLTGHQKVKAVVKEHNQLKTIYDGMLNLTKLQYYANALHDAAATLQELQTAAQTLVQNVKTLRDDDTGDALAVRDKFEKVQQEFNALDNTKQPNVKGQFQALKGAYEHIIIHYPKTLQKAAGTSESDPSDGLRALANDLHTHASALDTEVKKANTEENAAKVLRAKAGTDEQKNDPKYLRKLAEDLYNAANLLADALKTAVNTDDGNAASNLANAVGENENTGSTLREKLRELADHNVDTNLTVKAQAVKTQYTQVSGKFQAVETQNSSGSYRNHQTQYQAVVDAWTAFKAVYNADLKKLANNLKTAVGENDRAADSLQQALKDLKDNSGDEKAQDVIKKFNAVAAAYDKVKELETTYKNIVATQTHYDNVVSKFTELQEDKKLKDAADTLSGQAGTLSGNANTLHGELQKLGTDTAAQAARDKVNKLKNAASKSGDGEDQKGLEQLLGDLNGASGPAVVAKAKLVKDKFADDFAGTTVQKAYNAVKDDPTASGNAGFTAVRDAFTELQTEYNKTKQPY